MRAEAESRDGSAGHSQSSEAEPDLAAGAAVEPRCSTGTNSNETPKVAEWKASRPLFRDCNYGGSFCELLAVEAVQEYLTFHGLQDTQKALVSSQCPAMLGKAFLGITVPSLVPSLAPLHGPGDVAVQAELAVMKALQDFDDGKREPFLQQWKSLVPSNSPSGGSLELRVRVYFGTYKTRKALLANDPETPLLEPDFSDLKAFLSSRPSAMGSDPSSNSLSSLYALPFVPQPHQNSALRFIFKEPWSQQLRSDLQAFMTAYTGTRHAPSLRHLADGMIQARCPMTSPPPASWQELLRLAEIGFSASSYALAKLQTFGSCPAPQSLERDDRQDDELLDWLGSGGKMLPELLKQVADLRKRLGAVARHPTDEPPSVQETPGSMRPSMQSLLRAQSVDWEPQGVSTPVPLLQDRLWPREALRGSSASSLNASNSNAGAVRRLHSARSIESRSRSATALLPVPPALDFGRIAALLGDATEDAAAPPMLSVLRAVLRRLALPDEAIRPRRAFLAAFACFGAVRALAGKLPQIVNADQQLLEMSLAVMGVCACEVVGRREIEAAEALGTGCIAALIAIASLAQRSLQHMHCLAVLQRLSLRGRLQSKMIQLGALDVVLKLLQSIKKPEADPHSWCRLGPGEGPETPDFSIEFTSALLMNLTLRSAGRRRCGELGAYAILVGLIEHPNAQVRTHINGTLYTLLGVKAIRSEAQKRGAEVVFRSALERVAPENELLQRQLEFLLHQLSRSAGDGDSDGEDSEDGDPPQSIASPEDGGGPGDADDGDNFLDEEELAAHFHLASTSAVGPGDGYSQAEIDANSKAAAAEAAAAEEALRYFRATAGPVAESQQRRFHAFIARSCRNLMSPKRRGHSSDRLASPLSPPMLSPRSSPEPSLKPPGPPVTVTSSMATVETPPSQQRDVPQMDPYREASPPMKGSGKGDGGVGKASQVQVQQVQQVATQERGAAAKQPLLSGKRPESRQLAPKADPSANEGRGGRSASVGSSSSGKGRGRGTRSGPTPGASGAAAVTKSASLPPLPENKASSGRTAAQLNAGAPSNRARSEAPKRNQQANQQAAAAIEVATSVGQDRGFRRRHNSKTSTERSARDGNAQLPQLPKRR